MKTCLSALFLSVAFSLYSEEPSHEYIYPQERSFFVLDEKPSIDCDQYKYVAGGLAYVVPFASLGYRFQREHFGGDATLSFTTLPSIFFATGLQIGQLYYPWPNIDREWYIGLSEGVGYMQILSSSPKHLWDVLLGIQTGYQFELSGKRHFIEGKILTPVAASMENGFPIPILIISYGRSF